MFLLLLLSLVLQLLEELPRILTLQLKRFTFDVRLGTPKKINRHIPFTGTLTVSSNYMSSALKQRRAAATAGDSGEIDEDVDVSAAYDLFAVVVHCGQTAAGGHYKSYVKLHNIEHPDGCWFCCDDDIVAQVSAEQVFKQSAYLLFYEEVTS